MTVATHTPQSLLRNLATGRFRRLAVPLAAVIAVPLVAVALPALTRDDAKAATVNAALPFDMPSKATLRASKKLVLAHYWPPLPISIDNKAPDADYYARNYLTTNGENGKHQAYGGYLRDRPIPRAPRAGADWRVEDLKVEVQQAIDAGLDGFTLNILQFPGDKDTAVAAAAPNLLKAAQEVDPDFKIMLMPDMSGSLANKSVTVVADYMAQLAASPNAYRLSDGRLMIAPFKAEAHTVAWWTDFMNIMRTKHGLPVAFLPTFVGHEDNYATGFAPISYGMSIWGSRNPAWTDPTLTYATSPLGRAAKLKSLNQKWMQPVAVQDVRPNQGIFDEAANTQTLRNTWDLAQKSNAEFVQMVSWTDYSETTHFAPSVKHGWSFLDISSYYINLFKTGSAPKIVRDTVYVTHRSQFAAASPTFAQTKVMKLRGGTPARDTVEALTFLTAPSKVTINVGRTSVTCDAPAGMSTCIAPLAVGEVKASVTRDGATTASVVSGTPVTATPYVQDLQYVAYSSGRQGGGASPAPAPTTPPVVTPTPAPTPTVTPTVPQPTATPTTPAPPVVTPTPTPTGPQATPTPTPTVPGGQSVIAIEPIADTYANEGAKSVNYATTSSLVSRGKIGATSYLKFTLPVTPSGKTLTGAELRLRTTSDSFAGSTGTHLVAMSEPSADTTAITWNNRPSLSWAVGTIPKDTKPATTVVAPLSTDVMRFLTADPGATHTFAVTSSGIDNLWFWSSNHSNPSFRPQLVLTYG